MSDPMLDKSTESEKDENAAQTAIQTLRLELTDRDQRIQRLSQEIERLHFAIREQAGEQVYQEMEHLIAETAGPVTQILLQADLVEKQGKNLQSRDILTVARRLVRSLENHGLELVGAIGEKAAFQPDIHAFLSNSESCPPGHPVTVRLVGIQYRGKILRKASVEKAED